MCIIGSKFLCKNIEIFYLLLYSKKNLKNCINIIILFKKKLIRKLWLKYVVLETR